MADIKRADVLTYLENANMIEVSELITEIEEKFGVTAAAPVVGAAPAAEAVMQQVKRRTNLMLFLHPLDLQKLML